MIEEKEKTIKVKRKTYICDKCGKTVKNNNGCCGSSPIMKCRHCDIDICVDCRHLEYDIADYPTGCYCDDCWAIGKEYKQQMEEATIAYDELMEKIENDWEAECIKNRKVNPL